MKRFYAAACAAALLVSAAPIARGQEEPARPTLLVSLQLPLQGNADRLFRGKLQRAMDRLTTHVLEGGLRLDAARGEADVVAGAAVEHIGAEVAAAIAALHEPRIAGAAIGDASLVGTAGVAAAAAVGPVGPEIEGLARCRR